MIRRVARPSSPCLLGLAPRSTAWASARRSSIAALVVAIIAVTAPGAHADVPPIATIGLTPGWITFGQAVPQGLASTGLKIGVLDTQTDVKTTWPDGSIRFAVLTANAPAPGSYTVAPAPVAGGRFSPALPNASVALTIGGVVFTASLPSVSSSDQWLSGPLVYEGRDVVTPVSSANGSGHPFLRVIFDTRVYLDGNGRVDVTVENVLDRVGATTVTYDVAVTVSGSRRFSQASVEHYYLTRWRQTLQVGLAPWGSVQPDMTPFNQSGALPPYLSLVTNEVNTAAGPEFNILREGALSQDMSAHSGRAELAPFPDWTARYLVHKDPTQRQFVLANGDLSGSWPIHVREAGALSGVGEGRFVSINQRPTLWFDARAEGEFMQDGVLLPDGTRTSNTPLDYIKGTPLPMREYGLGIPAAGQSPLTPDNAHQPSLAYVPYLLTGDRYYADEMAFWGDYGMIRTYPADGARSNLGLLENNEVRGYGWALRNIVDAAAYFPEAALNSYFAAKVTANLVWLDGYALAATNPFKALWTGYRPEVGFISLWEQAYLAYAIDRANRQGFVGGLAHRDAIANLQLRLFTDPDYPRESPAGVTWSAPYLLKVGTPGSCVDNSTGKTFECWDTFTFFHSMAEVTAGTVGLGCLAHPDPLNPQPQCWLQRDYAGFYGPEARLDLMMLIESGNTLAPEAYRYLFPFIGETPVGCASSNLGTRPDLDCRPGWALDFYPAAPSVAFVPCLPGSYRATPTDALCTPAPAGSYVSTSGATSATLCAAGMYSALPGATACTPASAGSFVSATGATSATPCALGTFSAATGAATCTPAPAGKYVGSVGAIAAIPCAPGTYSAVPGASACTLAPAGSFVSGAGATAATPCPAGTTSMAGATSCAAIVNTPASPSPVTAQASPLVTVTFSNVSRAGTTTAVAIDPATAGAVPGGFTLPGLAYEVSTTAAVTPPITVCFSTPTIADPVTFSMLRILHNEGGTLVDRTILAPEPLAPNFGARTVCARVTSLSPFAVGLIVNPLSKFVVFSNDMTWLKAQTTVVTGDVGANTRAKHRHGGDADNDGDADDVTVRIGEQVTMQQPGSRVVGDTVRLGNKASVYNVVDNFLINRARKATIRGTITKPMMIPFLTLPAFPSVTPGTAAVEVPKGSTRTLGPGAYGAVHVSNRATLILTGGLYQMLSLDVDQAATVMFRAATEIRIKTELDTDNRARMIPDPAATGLKASQIVIYVAGTDASCHHNGRDEESGDEGGRSVAHIGENNIVSANIYAPNGTIWIKSRTQATGAFVGDDVRIGQSVTLTLDSVFR